jgi:xylulokinase
VGVVRSEIARTLGLGPDVLVSGSGDNMMGAIGTGNVADGIVTASLGTSGTIYACSEQPIVDPAGEVAAFCDATGRWLPLVCTMNVTVATEMVRKMFGMDHAALSVAASSVPPGSHGLMLIPFFEGERTPNVPDGTGVWVGVRPQTSTSAHLARAAMEGVTLGLNYGLNRLRSLGLAPREIRLTGGGSRSAVWRQIAADVFDCPVVCPASEEGAAYGAALHAMWVWHHARGEDVPIADIAQRFVALDAATRAVPDQGAAGVYREMQELFDEAARDLAGVFARHRRLVSGKLS